MRQSLPLLSTTFDQNIFGFDPQLLLLHPDMSNWSKTKDLTKTGLWLYRPAQTAPGAELTIKVN